MAPKPKAKALENAKSKELRKQNVKFLQQEDNETLSKFGGKLGDKVRSIKEMEELHKKLNFK